MSFPCRLCGSTPTEKHRIWPGVMGGEYVPSNVVRLCHEHHSGLHWLMDVKEVRKFKTDRRIKGLLADPALAGFFTSIALPVVQGWRTYLGVRARRSKGLSRLPLDCFAALARDAIALHEPGSVYISVNFRWRLIHVVAGGSLAFVFDDRMEAGVLRGWIERQYQEVNV